MVRFKQGVVNAMLFCAARLGDTIAVEQLVAGIGGVASQVNVVDDFGRSPLYWAVQVCLVADLGPVEAVSAFYSLHARYSVTSTRL
jgi:hypothetical protein